MFFISHWYSIKYPRISNFWQTKRISLLIHRTIGMCIDPHFFSEKNHVFFSILKPKKSILSARVREKERNKSYVYKCVCINVCIKLLIRLVCILQFTQTPLCRPFWRAYIIHHKYIYYIYIKYTQVFCTIFKQKLYIIYTCDSGVWKIKK